MENETARRGGGGAEKAIGEKRVPREKRMFANVNASIFASACEPRTSLLFLDVSHYYENFRFNGLKFRNTIF